MSRKKANAAWADKSNLPQAYPQGVEWDINIPHINLLTLLDQTIVRFSRRPAIDFMDKKITYEEFGQMVNKAAKGLQDMGVRPGQKVGLYMPNTPYYPIMFFAALRAGASVVNFSPLYTQEELENQCKDSGTDVMVTTELKEFYDKTVKLRTDGHVNQVVQCPIYDMLPTFKSYGYRMLKRKEIASPVTSDSAHGLNNTRRFVTFGELVDNAGDYTAINSAPDSPAVFQYTGGTTGVPKGAMLSHFNLVANTYQIQEYFGTNPKRENPYEALHEGREKVLAAIPYFHVFGMMVAMVGSMKLGGELIIMPNPRDTKELLKTIEKKQPTLFPAVPRLLQSITEYPKVKNYDLTSLENVISGGAALPDNVKQDFEKAVGKKDIIIQGYGLSETSPVAASNPPEGKPNLSETVGMPYPKTEIRIVDPDNPNKVKAIGEVGEICIRGPQVMLGYHNKPEETAQVLTDDGWYLTGDLGFLDEAMYLKIVDRKKRMIIVNGHNAYPSQIESALCKHPSIAEAVVIGIPDDRSGEAGKAFIRYRPDLPKDERPDADYLRAFLAKSLNKLDIPKIFEVREQELPKTSIGKPDFKALEEEERIKREQQGLNNNKPSAPSP
ncbi:MAG: long-chain fatty acid--CoA ligase [Pseudomonadota bacterium]|nr:AMP-binding protein [Alphaproteobacteria bacterium]MEC7702541.1 long-chain fatty acid--CoA ligase [Pseudomonadota bacterium]|tara:strand:+ start:68371 stop:70200 length:1830 start_codon:yes stop_codon:yes gene_type:complete